MKQHGDGESTTGGQGKKGGAKNYPKAKIDVIHLGDALLAYCKSSRAELPFYLHDYESLWPACAPRLYALFQLKDLIQSMTSVCPDLNIRYCDLKYALEQVKRKMPTGYHYSKKNGEGWPGSCANGLMVVQKHVRDLAKDSRPIDAADLGRFAKTELKLLVSRVETKPQTSPTRSSPAISPGNSFYAVSESAAHDDCLGDVDLSQASSGSVDSDGFPIFDQVLLGARNKAQKGLPSTKRELYGKYKQDHASKKPAASPTMLPTSSAKTTSKKGPLNKTKKAPKSSPWKLMHSRIYSAVRAQRFAEHGDDEKAKQQASKACAAAKVKFDKGEELPY